MPGKRAQFEYHAWSLAQRAIGRSLRELYEQSEQLPPRLAALAAELDEKTTASAKRARPSDKQPRSSRSS